MRIINNIISFKEKMSFRKEIIPSLESALNRIPKGDMMHYIMATVNIGQLEWQSGWQKDYKPYVDPPFRVGVPWDVDDTSENNIIQQPTHMDIITRKEAGRGNDGILYSNWTIKYGTIQVLAKLSDIQGAFSAIWLYGKDGLPEFDFEHCGQWNNQVTATGHWGYDYDYYGKKSTLHNERKNRKFYPTDEYHLYEIELSPYETIWRINGLDVRRTKEGANAGKQHLILSIGKVEYCGSEENGTLSEDAKMEVRWVRTFKMA